MTKIHEDITEITPSFRQKLMPYIPLLLILILIALIINIALFVKYLIDAQDIARLLRECDPIKICGFVR